MHMNWEAVTAVATAFTGCVIAVTAILGVYQLRQLRDQRRDTAAIGLVRSIQDDTLAQAYRTVFLHPDDAGFDTSALVLGFRFEMLGLLVHRGTIPFETAEQLIGGLVLGTWRRLRKTVGTTRSTLQWPTYMEWFQWLAEPAAARCLNQRRAPARADPHEHVRSLGIRSMSARMTSRTFWLFALKT
jgi:hypothetical protein